MGAFIKILTDEIDYCFRAFIQIRPVGVRPADFKSLRVAVSIFPTSAIPPMLFNFSVVVFMR